MEPARRNEQERAATAAAPAAAPSGVAGAAPRAAWTWGIGLVLLATAVRLCWVLAVPTVPVSDFAMYRESANHLSELGSLDSGFIYMPGFVALLAWIKDMGGDLLAQKMLGVFFGGLGAAGLFVATLALFDLSRDPEGVPVPPRDGLRPAEPGYAGTTSGSGRWARGWLPCPVAAVATLVYALWPAGVATASVVGTDVPAAALVAAALACLGVLGPRRPWAAALAFGAVMGLAAWLRAVALPLTALSAGYWLARRVPPKRVAALAAAAVGATLLVLAPWGVHHLRQTGELYFTDDHGGITALIGANPNSQGTYTRALNQMFRDLHGHSVLDQPHRQVDREAYALAREWTRFEPAYSLGLGIMKAERLFEPEQRLLYWPLFRPGVLVGRPAAWFQSRREAIGELADRFGVAVVALALAGVGIAAARRRRQALALVPFQLALAATYTIFFAEPRYRLPIEMLAFPFVALTLVEVGRAGGALGRRAWPALRASASPFAAALALIVVWHFGWPALLDAGARLRARHRWAATEWRVAGHPRLCKWRPTGLLPAISPVEGAPSGVRLRAGGGASPTTAAVELGGGPLAGGTYALHLRVEPDGAPVQLRILGQDGTDGTVGAVGAVGSVGAVGPPVPASVDLLLHHAGGPLRLTATLSSPAPASVWISEVTLDPVPDPAPPASAAASP
jgi:hypothetical protein